MGQIRCGDTVKHGPTGETWLVAYADYERNQLAWYGWPEGYAELSDCELVKSCDDAEHARSVSEWTHKKGFRAREVQRLYP